MIVERQVIHEAGNLKRAQEIFFFKKKKVKTHPKLFLVGEVAKPVMNFVHLKGTCMTTF